MPQKQEIIAELKSVFSFEKNDEYLDDFGRIGEFLSQQDKVKVGVKVLEDNLIARLQRRLSASGELSDDNLKAAQSYFITSAFRAAGTRRPRSQAYENYSHLLSEELSAGEIESGLAVDAPSLLVSQNSQNKVDVMVGFVAAKTFLEQVAKGRHWKDPGAKPDHGDYTHRIQWYLITKQLKLKHPAGVVFAATGKYSAKLDGIEMSVFTFLVDRYQRGSGAPSGKDSTDFRCPEYLNRWIISQGIAFPLLSSILAGRRQKRLNYDVRDYLAAKLYQKRSFNELSAGQQKEVEALSKRGDYILQRQS